MSTLFISYSHTDDLFVRRLRDDLIARGHVVHWDMDAFTEEDLPARLDQWIRESPVHLAVLSHRYLQSTLPMQELAKFLRATGDWGTTLVPVLLQKVELPESLWGIPTVDFTRGYETGFERLEARLKLLDEPEHQLADAASATTAEIESRDPEPGAEAVFAVVSGTTAGHALGTETERVLAIARVLARTDGGLTTPVEPEHLSWAVFLRGRETQEHVTAWFCWRWLSERVRPNAWTEALTRRFPHLLEPFDLDAPEPGPLDERTLRVLDGAEEIARRTTNGNPWIHVRHLVADLFLVARDGASVPPLLEVITRLNADTAGFADALVQFVERTVPGDDPHVWADLLTRRPAADGPGPAGLPPAAPAPDASAAPRPTAGPFSMLRGSISDQSTETDVLGFGPYVRAVAEFLTSPDTKPPLTLSIEGEWGSGKSSFMKQLQGRIRDLEKEHGRKAPVTVWFNPWRHDKEEAVWAAFALEFLRGVTRELPFGRRWAGHLRLLWRRFSWRDGWWDFARAVGVGIGALAATGLIAYLLWSGGGLIDAFTRALRLEQGNGPVGALLKLGGIGGGLAVAATLWKEVMSFVGNPLRFDLKRYVRSPDYQARIAFIEHFHEDFGKIVKAYVGRRRVYVFIDDLDRCQTPKAGDLMQALNLMMGADEQPITFILGMDREKIAASLAVKFKDLLPFVTADPARPGKADDGEAALRGLEYGSEYIEKFVQLSFRVPQPRDHDVAELLRSISGRPGSSARAAPSTPPARRAASPADSALVAEVGMGMLRNEPARTLFEEGEAATAGKPAGSPEPADARRRALQEAVSVDSERLHGIVRMVAPALDYNPRRVKQFVNVFRLRAYLAIATGLITGAEPSPAGLTFEKLGKFVAIGLRWPLLLVDLDSEPDLLHRLQQRVLAHPLDSDELTHPGENGTVKVGWVRGAEGFWATRLRLLELLRAKVNDSEDAVAACYSLEGVPLGPLLQVAASPSVHADTHAA